MKRIILLVTVALMMAAMLAVSAPAAFAKRNCHFEGSTLVCSGGGPSEGHGGAGGHSSLDFETGAFESSSGFGNGDLRYGRGAHCEGNIVAYEECTGRHYSGNQ
jgi:hypothetical protein